MLVSSTPQNTTPELSPINVTVAQYLTFCGGSLFEKDFLEKTTMSASQVQNNNSLSLPYKHAARSLQQIKTLSSGITSEHKSKCLSRPHHFMKEHPCLGDRQLMRQGGEDQKRNGAWPWDVRRHFSSTPLAESFGGSCAGA